MPQHIDDLFDLDAEAEAIEYPPFNFTQAGKKYQLPNLYTLAPGQMERIDEVKDYDEVVDLFAEFGAKPVGELLAKLPPSKGFLLMARWRRHSVEAFDPSTLLSGEEGEEGKGSTSSPSSGTNRAARRSKPTSRSGASTSGGSRSGSRKRS